MSHPQEKHYVYIMWDSGNRGVVTCMSMNYTYKIVK